MEYKINVTEDFSSDMEEICYYIENYLKSLHAANKLRKKVVHFFLLLEENPRMFPAIEKMDRVKRRYRKIVINNYILLYTISNENVIYISHMYYIGRNYLNGLM